MSPIKNIHKISHLLTESQIAKLEEGARQHLRFSNIEFDIHRLEGEHAVIVGAIQGKTTGENYASQKILITRGKELFRRVLPEGFMVHVHAKVYDGD